MPGQDTAGMVRNHFEPESVPAIDSELDARRDSESQAVWTLRSSLFLARCAVGSASRQCCQLVTRQQVSRPGGFSGYGDHTDSGWPGLGPADRVPTRVPVIAAAASASGRKAAP